MSRFEIPTVTARIMDGPHAGQFVNIAAKRGARPPQTHRIGNTTYKRLAELGASGIWEYTRN